jgi:uncharacterized membrane protein
VNLRLPLTLSVFLVAIMAAISAWACVKLPESAVIATHWGVDGKVNGTMPKDWGLAVLPAIALAMTLLLAAIPSIEPRRANMIASRKPFYAFWLGGLVVLAVAHALVVGLALGYPIDVPGVLIVLLPLSIAIGGNYLGKARPNFFIGVRTPWTLSSDLSWDKTHRMLGRLLVWRADRSCRPFRHRNRSGLSGFRRHNLSKRRVRDREFLRLLEKRPGQAYGLGQFLP